MRQRCPLIWWWAPAVLALAGATACGDQTRGRATPTAMEPPPKAGAPAERERVQPSAADTPVGGSSGNRGMPAVPDASGGPDAGGTAQQSRGAAVPPSAPASPGSAQPGLPAEATGRMGSQGNTNSTPNSSTGNASR